MLRNERTSKFVEQFCQLSTRLILHTFQQTEWKYDFTFLDTRSALVASFKAFFTLHTLRACKSQSCSFVLHSSTSICTKREHGKNKIQADCLSEEEKQDYIL